MDHHRTSCSVDRHAWLLAVLAPTVATVGDVLALVLVVESDRTFSDEIRMVLLLAFWFFPAMVAFGVNWWHPGATTAFREVLAAGLQLLIVPVMWWIAVDESGRWYALVFGSLIGMALTTPAVLTGFLGASLGQQARRRREAR